MKYATKIRVVAGNDVTHARPQAKATTPDPAEHWGYVEGVIRNTHATGGKVTHIEVALESIVGPTGLAEFLDALKHGEFAPFVPQVEEVHGRVVSVRSQRGRLPTWTHLASTLLGTGQPCEDFRIVDGMLHAKLKTAAQRELETAARVMDEYFWAQRDVLEFCRTEGLHQASEHAGEKTDESAPIVRRVRSKKRPPGGNSLLVLQAMELKFPSEAPTMKELYAVIGHRIEAPAPKRRAEYFRKAVAKLADVESNQWLYRHEGDRIALTATLPEEGGWDG